jgi:hypothetical protein
VTLAYFDLCTLSGLLWQPLLTRGGGARKLTEKSSQIKGKVLHDYSYPTVFALVGVKATTISLFKSDFLKVANELL